jgi:hypothetical protein
MAYSKSLYWYQKEETEETSNSCYCKLHKVLTWLLCSWTLFSGILKNTMFWKMDLIPSSGDGKGAPNLVGLLNRANFKHSTVMLSSLECKMMDKVWKPSKPVLLL